MTRNYTVSKKPDRYEQCDITSPIHNVYLLFFGRERPYSILNCYDKV